MLVLLFLSEEKCEFCEGGDFALPEAVSLAWHSVEDQ